MKTNIKINRKHNHEKTDYKDANCAPRPTKWAEFTCTFHTYAYYSTGGLDKTSYSLGDSGSEDASWIVTVVPKPMRDLTWMRELDMNAQSGLERIVPVSVMMICCLRTAIVISPLLVRLRAEFSWVSRSVLIASGSVTVWVVSGKSRLSLT